ncbi:MAG: hypothetical protein JWM43_396 [Acidobacteriaceae bacterium]|nr:hypothetical protein [Acidobacteriaceae bacterium]
MGFSEFIRERQYLHNVTPATLEWYKNSFRWLPSDSPSQDQLNELVISMRQKGLKATGCNCVIRAINSYLHWSGGSNRKCGAGCTHPRIAQLKEPQTVFPTLSEVQMFEKEPGVLVIERKTTMRKRRYRSIRIPRAVYERVVRRITR